MKNFETRPDFFDFQKFIFQEFIKNIFSSEKKQEISKSECEINIETQFRNLEDLYSRLSDRHQYSSLFVNEYKISEIKNSIEVNINILKKNKLWNDEEVQKNIIRLQKISENLDSVVRELQSQNSKRILDFFGNDEWGQTARLDFEITHGKPGSFSAEYLRQRREQQKILDPKNITDKK